MMGFARQLAPHEIAGQVREMLLADTWSGLEGIQGGHRFNYTEGVLVGICVFPPIFVILSAHPGRRAGGVALAQFPSETNLMNQWVPQGWDK